MSPRYRLFDGDGNDVGETRLAAAIDVGEVIHRGPDTPGLRVVALVPVFDEESPFVAFLQVEEEQHQNGMTL